MAEYMRAWRQANLERFRESAATRSQIYRYSAYTPAWADRDAIRAIYAEARRLRRETGQQYHVDHIIPLKGKNVCGLHVETNLRIIPALENWRKGNRVMEAAY